MKYHTILADPPWPYASPRAVVGNAGRGWEEGRAATIIQADIAQHYPTMSIEAICNLDIKSHAETDAHLYIWTTNSFMIEAHEVARAWGFEPKTILTWVKHRKDNPDEFSRKTGYWFRSATEHIVFSVRGHLRLQIKREIGRAHV